MLKGTVSALKQILYHKINNPATVVAVPDCLNKYQCIYQDTILTQPAFMITDINNLDTAISFSLPVDPTKITIFQKFEVIIKGVLDEKDQIILEIADTYFSDPSTVILQIIKSVKDISKTLDCTDANRLQYPIKFYEFSGSYQGRTKILYVRVYLKRNNASDTKGFLGLTLVQIDQYNLNQETLDCQSKKQQMLLNVCVNPTQIQSCLDNSQFIQIEDGSCSETCNYINVPLSLSAISTYTKQQPAGTSTAPPSSGNTNQLCSPSYNICNPKQLLSNCIACSKYNNLCLQCQDGYFLVDNACSQCKPGCKSCAGLASICTSCYFSNYLSSEGRCLQCIPNCLQCSSGDKCEICQKNYTLDKNGQCICLQSELKEPLTCTLCNTVLDGCNKCTENFQACTECDYTKNYILFKEFCLLSRCGDGMMLYPQGYKSNKQCDDGNNINGDGCSSTCQIEDDYECIIDQTKFKSICKIKEILHSDLNNYKIIPLMKSDKSAYENPLISINFEKPLINNVSCSEIMRVIEFEIEEVDQKNYALNCNRISDDRKEIELEFVFTSNIKNKTYKVGFSKNIKFNYQNKLPSDIKKGKFPTFVMISEQNRQDSENSQQVGHSFSNTIFAILIASVLGNKMQLLFTAFDSMQMMLFLLYVNIRLPFNILEFIEILNGFQFPFVPNLFQPFIDNDNNLPNYQIPQPFADNQFDGMFLKNTGDNITQFIIILGIHILLIVLISIKVKRLEKLRIYLENKTNDVWKWDYYLGIAWENFLPFSLACFIQFTDFESGDALALINLILSVATFVIISLLPLLFVRAIKSNQYQLKSENFKRWKLLIENLNIDSNCNNQQTIDSKVQTKDQSKEDIPNTPNILTSQAIFSQKNKNQIPNSEIKLFKSNSNNSNKGLKQPADDIQQYSDSIQSQNKQLEKNCEIKEPFQKSIVKYYFIYLYLRKYLFALILVFCWDITITQIFLFDILSLVNIFILILTQPYEKKSENVKNFLNEVLLIAAQSSLIYLVQDDEMQSEQERIYIGWTFVGSGLGIMGIEIIFITINLYYESFKPLLLKYKQSKLKKTQIHPQDTLQFENLSNQKEQIVTGQQSHQQQVEEDLNFIRQVEKKGIFLEMKQSNDNQSYNAQTQATRSQTMHFSTLTQIHPQNIEIKPIQEDILEIGPPNILKRFSTLYQVEQIEEETNQNQDNQLDEECQKNSNNQGQQILNVKNPF